MSSALLSEMHHVLAHVEDCENIIQQHTHQLDMVCALSSEQTHEVTPYGEVVLYNHVASDHMSIALIHYKAVLWYGPHCNVTLL